MNLTARPFATLTLLISLVASASSTRADRPATHGMLMVGSQAVYLSHLPMFHQPHDYQVILEAKLPEATRQAYAADRATSKVAVYTIVPEAFALPELIAGRTSFKADIVRGHFERGGTTIAQAASFEVTRVIAFKKFAAQATHPTELQYVYFGAGTDAFVAHVITARPDFDQVLAARAVAPTATGQVITVPARGQNDPLRPGETVAGLRLGAEIYFETGDLQ